MNTSRPGSDPEPVAPAAHPYIPNTAPRARAQMLAALDLAAVDELYADIPDVLRVDGLLDLPAPLTAESDLARHVDTLLRANTSTRDALSFLGGGCYDHHVPAVCDEINSRSEFLTAYAGTAHEDHGRFQALFEYASLMGELLDMDVVSIPVYDGYQATATSLRMAGRRTGRSRVLMTGALAGAQRSKIVDYLQPGMQIESMEMGLRTGTVDLDRLSSALADDVAAVLVQTPNYFGVVEPAVEQIGQLAHAHGALLVVSCDPICLGLIAAPAQLGADITCGDLQSLGMHQQFGGGQAGFIAVHDDAQMVAELPTRLFGITGTSTAGEYGFGDVAFDRTSFARREEGKEWVGTAAALWGITAGAYLALMGPTGMREIGQTIFERTRYAVHRLAGIPGISLTHPGAVHFREFALDLTATGRTLAEVDAALRQQGIFPGVDLSRDHPALGQALLVCVTERHSKSDIDRLAENLAAAL